MKKNLMILFIGFLLGFIFSRIESPVIVHSNEVLMYNELPTRILIPSVSIDTSVKKALIINGYWQVFPNSAAWGDQSGIPGNIGNQVIFAHKRSGLFANLKDVKIGDKIYVLTSKGSFAYEAREIKEINPNEIDVVKPTTDETLTLYTCSGFADTKRLIVVGKKV